jgi:micrococcal nuclease
MHEYLVNRVIRIVDADTLDLEIDLGFNVFTVQRVRLAGIDAPETRTRDFNEKQAGLESKEFVEKFIEDAEKNGYQIYVKTTLDDKYGRMLGRIVANNQCLNDLLLTNHLAFSYNGERKVPYSERLQD